MRVSVCLVVWPFSECLCHGEAVEKIETFPIRLQLEWGKKNIRRWPLCRDRSHLDCRQSRRLNGRIIFLYVWFPIQVVSNTVFFHRSLVLPWITFINDGSILSSSSSTPPARFHFARNDPQHNIHHIDIMCIFIFEFMLSQASFSIWNIATFHSKLKLGKKEKHRMKPNQARYLVSSQVSLTARTNTPHKKDLSFFAVP